MVGAVFHSTVDICCSITVYTPATHRPHRPLARPLHHTLYHLCLHSDQETSSRLLSKHRQPRHRLYQPLAIPTPRIVPSRESLHNLNVHVICMTSVKPPMQEGELKIVAGSYERTPQATRPGARRYGDQSASPTPLSS